MWLAASSAQLAQSSSLASRVLPQSQTGTNVDTYVWSESSDRETEKMQRPPRDSCRPWYITQNIPTPLGRLKFFKHDVIKEFWQKIPMDQLDTDGPRGA